MRYASIPFVVVTLLVARVSNAQQMPLTVADAEAEGATFPHDPSPAVLPAAYRAFFGSVERHCVSADEERLATSWDAARSMRSGEIILRGHSPEAGRPGNKMLWMPLHDPGKSPATLLIRGVRLDQPSDTLRQTNTVDRGPAREVGHPDSFGFPTTVEFANPGRWLVIANEGHDWGCFVLNVAGPTS
jgi:hypothetical protein